MPDLVLAADDPALVDDVEAAVGGPEMTLRVVTRGLDVLDEVRSEAPDLMVLDLQIGNMGGMACCMQLRLEESGGRLPHIPVLMLLDRRADVFLARRSGADGWLVKPLDPIRLRKAVHAILDGEDYHDATSIPTPVATGPTAEVG